MCWLKKAHVRKLSSYDISSISWPVYIRASVYCGVNSPWHLHRTNTLLLLHSWHDYIYTRYICNHASCVTAHASRPVACQGIIPWQATGLDAWASRVKCPARFVSHLHEICIYIWVVYSLCVFCCLFITVTWWYVWCIEWESGNQEEVQACLVTLWLFITSCYSLYKTTLGLLCSWFENNPHFHKYSMDFHV